jgi:hypothetical protein
MGCGRAGASQVKRKRARRRGAFVDGRRLTRRKYFVTYRQTRRYLPPLQGRNDNRVSETAMPLSDMLRTSSRASEHQAEPERDQPCAQTIREVGNRRLNVSSAPRHVTPNLTQEGGTKPVTDGERR